MSTGERLIQQGRIEGRREGREEGRQEGRREEREEVLIRLLNRRFGELPAIVMERVRGAGPSRLLDWLDRSVTARTLDEVLSEPWAHPREPHDDRVREEEEVDGTMPLPGTGTAF